MTKITCREGGIRHERNDYIYLVDDLSDSEIPINNRQHSVRDYDQYIRMAAMAHALWAGMLI